MAEDEQERLPLKTAEGDDLPPPPEEAWREHTAERWKERDPETYAQCLELIRTGMTNQSELARIFAPRSRNSIQALMMKEFKPGELNELAQKMTEIGRLTGAQVTIELMEKATAAKDVGSVAVATKLLHDMAQNLAGQPDRIIETKRRVTREDLQRIREKARAQQGALMEAHLVEMLPLPEVKEKALTND